MKKYKHKITIEGAYGVYSSFELPFDSSIEDWVYIFKAILISQSFDDALVKEIFNNT